MYHISKWIWCLNLAINYTQSSHRWRPIQSWPWPICNTTYTDYLWVCINSISRLYFVSFWCLCCWSVEKQGMQSSRLYFTILPIFLTGKERLNSYLPPNFLFCFSFLRRVFFIPGFPSSLVNIDDWLLMGRHLFDNVMNNISISHDKYQHVRSSYQHAKN